MGVILPWRYARGMAIRSPEVLGARSCVHAHSVSVIYQSKKCAKHHEMPVGSLCRRPGSRHTKARWAQAELSVFEWRASNAAAPYVVRTGDARQRGECYKRADIYLRRGFIALRGKFRPLARFLWLVLVSLQTPPIMDSRQQ